jgi:hypothetical protein
MFTLHFRDMELTDKVTVCMKVTVRTGILLRILDVDRHPLGERTIPYSTAVEREWVKNSTGEKVIFRRIVTPAAVN